MKKLYNMIKEEIKTTRDYVRMQKKNFSSDKKENGIIYALKSVWEIDRMLTEARHPGIGVYNPKVDLENNPAFSLGIIEEEVVHDDGKYQMTRTKSVPLYKALEQGKISQENYDAVIAAHTKKS